jgi:hypothetical protein
MNNLPENLSHRTTELAVIAPTQVTSIAQALNAKSINVQLARIDEDCRKAFAREVYRECYKFLQLMDVEDVKAAGMAHAFAEDVLDTRDDWRLEDVVVFFRVIRQRQDIPEFKVYGKVTILKLGEMMQAFDAIRAEERAEAARRLPKVEAGNEDMPAADPEKVKRMAEDMVARLQTKTKKTDLSRAVSTNNWHRENEQERKRLELEVEAGNMTKEEYLAAYADFMVRDTDK